MIYNLHKYFCNLQKNIHTIQKKNIGNKNSKTKFSIKTKTQKACELEDRITYVARKVVHLGDQLEASNSHLTNSHRSRDAEAERLMEIMMEFKLKSKSSQSI